MSRRDSRAIASGSPPREASGAGDATARVGPIVVRTERSEVEAFARALGLRATYGPVPLTFPIRWLGLPELREALAREFGVTDALLVQQSQAFEYVEPLALDRDYLIEVAGRRELTSPGRLALHATIRQGSGESVLTSETVLRLFDRSASPGASRRAPPFAEPTIPEVRVGPIDALQTRHYAVAALDDNPLHRDAEAARAVGLAGPVVHGMIVMGQFERALVAWRPDLRVTRLFATFLHPLPVGGRIVVGGRVARSTPHRDGEQLVLRLLARSAGDDFLSVGEVEAVTPAADGRPGVHA